MVQCTMWNSTLIHTHNTFSITAPTLALTDGPLYFSEDILIWYGLALLVFLDDLRLLVNVLQKDMNHEHRGR